MVDEGVDIGIEVEGEEEEETTIIDDSQGEEKDDVVKEKSGEPEEGEGEEEQEDEGNVADESEILKRLNEAEKSKSGILRELREVRGETKAYKQQIAELTSMLNKQSSESKITEEDLEDVVTKKDLLNFRKAMEEDRQKSIDEMRESQRSEQRTNARQNEIRNNKDFVKLEEMALELADEDIDIKADIECARDYVKAIKRAAKDHPEYDLLMRKQIREELAKELKKKSTTLPKREGKGKRAASEDDLTVDDIAGMTPEQTLALPKATRIRLGLGA